MSEAHALPHPFNFTFIHLREKAAYDEGIKLLGKVATVEQFWALYAYLKPPSSLPHVTEYHVFREGLQPLWEDPGNINGGKLILRVRKELSSRLWEDLVLGIIGDQFGVGEDVCGAVISVRGGQDDIISLWTRDAKNKQMTDEISDKLKTILGIPSKIKIEFKEHNQSLQDKSGLKNTNVFSTNH